MPVPRIWLVDSLGVIGMGIQHRSKSMRTLAKRLRKNRKHKLRSTKKYKK
ncbi:unnamed protein product [Tuwongella immobilis]|uniref:Uncharacterized protein n=1 Tax=Tuwongella immobilis TaxID=692036 RepID=A0A6C2YQY5_9BACT|nr:unnamed protein product [Tuwongella immobilis]VTS05487.1 unnamed protein product [Tuwongella immobilis]